jgi:DNA-directed RNA polymerase alpha subunit
MTEPELLKVRNFGKTSLKEVKSKLSALGLTLGINVEDYN